MLIIPKIYKTRHEVTIGAHAFNMQEWALKRGGWGLNATIEDYTSFVRMLVNEGRLNDSIILQPETVKLMATNHLDASVTEKHWLPSKGQVGFGIDFAVRMGPPAPEEKNGLVGEFFLDSSEQSVLGRS